MPADAPGPDDFVLTPRMRYFDVHSTDGTRLRAWTNDAKGPCGSRCGSRGHCDDRSR